eukprot:scaffold529_cov308-Pinguiococcus_pyrenoidosus.AAC.72
MACICPRGRITRIARARGRGIERRRATRLVSTRHCLCSTRGERRPDHPSSRPSRPDHATVLRHASDEEPLIVAQDGPPKLPKARRQRLEKHVSCGRNATDQDEGLRV